MSNKHYTMPEFVECEEQKFLRLYTYSPQGGGVLVVNLTPKESKDEDAYNYEAAIYFDSDSNSSSMVFSVPKNFAPDKSIYEFSYEIVKEYKRYIWRQLFEWQVVANSLLFSSIIQDESVLEEAYKNQVKSVDIAGNNMTAWAIQNWKTDFTSK